MTQTLPNRRQRIPVRKIMVEVVSGPDVARPSVTGTTITVGSAQGNDLVLTDRMVSRYHAALRTAGSDVVLTDQGSTNGTRIGPVTLNDGAATLEPGSLILVGDTTLRVSDGGLDMVDVATPPAMGGFVGRSPAFRDMLVRIGLAAKSDVPVLILGESGTGKDLVARALHEHGPRANRAIVTLDGAALTANLYASELFGHERGAFTGAVNRHIGAFERATGGTLFLDEAGELDEAMQSALLGAIERGKIRRVGGTAEVSADVRLICATHQDLRARVNDGRFRLDLYYRIAVIVIETPPLRDRVEDLELLIDHFLQRTGESLTARDVFSSEQLAQLRRHHWPGNIRELRNVVARALAVPQEDVLELDTSGPMLAASASPPSTLWTRPFKEARRTALDQFESGYLQDLLRRNDGSLRKSAREAEIDRSYLLQLLRRHGLRE